MDTKLPTTASHVVSTPQPEDDVIASNGVSILKGTEQIISNPIVQFIFALLMTALYFILTPIYGTILLTNIEDKLSIFEVLMVSLQIGILLLLMILLRNSFLNIVKNIKASKIYLLFSNQDKALFENILKCIKLCNNYVLLAFVLSIVVLLSGIMYIDAKYNKVPFEIVKWYPATELKDSITISKATCNSNSYYYKTFVMNGTIYCEFNMTYGNTPYRLTAISVNGFNDMIALPEQRNYQAWVNVTKSQYRFSFGIPTQNYMLYQIQLLFNDNTDKPWYETTIGIYDIIPSQNYRDWMHQKGIAFFALLSAIFITVTVGVSNLKKIIEDK